MFIKKQNKKTIQVGVDCTHEEGFDSTSNKPIQVTGDWYGYVYYLWVNGVLGALGKSTNDDVQTYYF